MLILIYNNSTIQVYIQGKAKVSNLKIKKIWCAPQKSTKTLNVTGEKFRFWLHHSIVNTSTSETHSYLPYILRYNQPKLEREQQNMRIKITGRRRICIFLSFFFADTRSRLRKRGKKNIKQQCYQSCYLPINIIQTTAFLPQFMPTHVFRLLRLAWKEH